MNKKEIYEYLKEKNIWHEITEHKAVYNMEELSEIDMAGKQSQPRPLLIGSVCTCVLRVPRGASSDTRPNEES